MRFSTKLFPGMVAAFLVIASSLGAFTLIESNSNQKVLVARADTFRVHVQLAQVALCDGSVKLQPGGYNVEIFSMGDGSVRATFFDQTGRKAGEAHGIIAVLRPVAAPATNLPAVQSQGTNAQKVSPASPIREAALHFTALGFEPNSRSSFSQRPPAFSSASRPRQR